jgi:hypothetical protein
MVIVTMEPLEKLTAAEPYEAVRSKLTPKVDCSDVYDLRSTLRTSCVLLGAERALLMLPAKTSSRVTRSMLRSSSKDRIRCC